MQIYERRAAMPLLDSLKNAGAQTAKIEVWTEFENTMMYIPPEERKPKPEPKHYTYTVKKGDKVDEGDFIVKDIKPDSLTVEFTFDFVGNAYGEDGYSARNYKPGQVFTFNKGETLSLSMYGLMDADSKVYIKYLE